MLSKVLEASYPKPNCQLRQPSLASFAPVVSLDASPFISLFKLKSLSTLAQAESIRLFRTVLAKRPEKTIAVVTHWGVTCSIQLCSRRIWNSLWL